MKQERMLSALPTLLAMLGFSAGLCFCRITGYYADLPLPDLPAFGCTPAELIRAFLPWFLRTVQPMLLLYLSGFTCFALPCGLILLPWQGFLFGTLAACLSGGRLSDVVCCAFGAAALLFYVNMCRCSLEYATVPAPSGGLLSRCKMRETRLYTLQSLSLVGLLLMAQLLLFTLSFFGAL